MNKWISRSRFVREKNKMKKQTLNVIFNYSSIELSEHMTNVLNKGLKFSILPSELDITQLLTDLKKFERTMVWREFWFGRNVEEDDEKKPIFKRVKTNFPKNHSTPVDLKNYLAAIKSDIMDPRNRNKVQRNLSSVELEAIKQITQLQKERKIVVKPCDKGAGLIVLNFDAYMEACENHLNSTMIGPNDILKAYYEKVDLSALEEAKQKINLVLQEGFDNNYLTKDEFREMIPDEKTAGKFYCTFKVHKQHIEGTTPPERPIISGSGSIIDNLGLFVEHNLKNLSNKHKT